MVNFAIIGCGTWGKTIIRRICEEGIGKIVAIADINKKSLDDAKKILEREGTKELKEYSNGIDLLRDLSGEDVVIVDASSSKCRFLHTILATKLGFFAFLEKPLCMRLEELEMIKKADNLGKITVDFIEVENPCIVTLEEIIDSKEIEEINIVRASEICKIKEKTSSFREGVTPDCVLDKVMHEISLINLLRSKKFEVTKAHGEIYELGGSPVSIYGTKHFRGKELMAISMADIEIISGEVKISIKSSTRDIPEEWKKKYSNFVHGRWVGLSRYEEMRVYEIKLRDKVYVADLISKKLFVNGKKVEIKSLPKDQIYRMLKHFIEYKEGKKVFPIRGLSIKDQIFWTELLLKIRKRIIDNAISARE